MSIKTLYNLLQLHTQDGPEELKNLLATLHDQMVRDKLEDVLPVNQKTINQVAELLETLTEED